MTGHEQGISGLNAALQRQQLVEQTPDFLAVVRGPDHVFEFVNKAYLKLIGGRPCLGRRFRDVVPETLTNGIHHCLSEVYRTGESFAQRDFHSRLESSENDEDQKLLISFGFRPLRDRDGTVSGIYIEGSNVAQHAADKITLEILQEEARQRLAELERIYASAPVALAVLGAERFEYRRVNQRQAELVGLRPDQLVGHTVREISPDLADAAETLFRLVAAGEHVRDVELEGESPARPGEKRSWLVSYSPIHLSNGAVGAIISTTVDTTDLRRAQKALLQNEKLAAVGRLAGSIAHEINNPLEAITNLLYLARHSPTLGEAVEFLDSAEVELRRVAAITSQTLRFHRQVSNPRSITCTDMFDAGLSLFKGKLEGLMVVVHKRKRAKQPVLCFDGEIRQVMNNLIGNAIEAMAPDGGRLLLRSREGMERRSGQQGLWLTVADTGSGMSFEAYGRAFEAFFTTKGSAGTGLGLWISSEIIKRHGGRLLLRSSQGASHPGTVFSIFLPFAAVLR